MTHRSGNDHTLWEPLRTGISGPVPTQPADAVAWYCCGWPGLRRGEAPGALALLLSARGKGVAARVIIFLRSTVLFVPIVHITSSVPSSASYHRFHCPLAGAIGSRRASNPSPL